MQDLQFLHEEIFCHSYYVELSEYCWECCCRLGITCGQHSRRLATCRYGASIFCRCHLSNRLPLNKRPKECMNLSIQGKLFWILIRGAHQAAALRSLRCINIEGAAAAPSGGIGKRQEGSAGAEPAIAQEDRGDWIKGPLTAAQRRAWRDKLGGSWKWSQALPGAQLPDVMLPGHMCRDRQGIERPAGERTYAETSWAAAGSGARRGQLSGFRLPRFQARMNSDRHKTERLAGERTCSLARCAQTETRLRGLQGSAHAFRPDVFRQTPD